MTGDEDQAVDAAADGIVHGCQDPAPTGDPADPDVRRELARLVFTDCRNRAPAMDEPQLTAAPSPYDDLVTRLAGVTRPQRDVLALCVYGGHSIEEAASLLGISASSAHHYLAWGLRGLAATGAPRP